MRLKQAICAMSLATAILTSTAALAAEFQTHQFQEGCGDWYELRNGTVFKKTGPGYVGYMGYNQEVAFLNDREVCIKGNRYRYTLYEAGSRHHHSIRRYTGDEAHRKFAEVCGR